MKTFQIALDGYEANTSQRVGSNVYAYEVLKALEKRSRKSKLIEFTVFTPGHRSQDLPQPRPGWNYQSVKPRLYSQWSLPISLYKEREKYDLFFTTSHYAPRFCPIPYISSVMDLGFLDYPHFFKTLDYMKLKLWTAYSVKHAKKVLAISQFTQSQVIKHYGVDKKATFVAYPGNTLLKKDLKNQDKSLLKKWSLSESPYILFIGTLQPRKNLVRIIKAFSLIKLQPHSQKLKLVIAGKSGWLSKSIEQTIKDSPHSKEIIRTGFISHTEKNELLRHASTVLMVGLHEGFGIPALECQNFGVVPVVSNNSSLPEVVGDAGILVNPLDITAIAEGILKVLALSESEKKQHQKIMKKNLEKFTWQNTADRIYKMMLKTLREVGSDK